MSKSKFNLQVIEGVSDKRSLYEKFFGNVDYQQNRNSMFRIRKQEDPKLTASQITTICEECGISLNEFFINDDSIND